VNANRQRAIRVNVARAIGPFGHVAEVRTLCRHIRTVGGDHPGGLPPGQKILGEHGPGGLVHHRRLRTGMSHTCIFRGSGSVHLQTTLNIPLLIGALIAAPLLVWTGVRGIRWASQAREHHQQRTP
jgi:hypothetical protein